MPFFETTGGAALIQGILGGASGVAGGIGAGKRQKRQHAHQKQMAEYAFNKQREMWQEANQYNHPVEMMKRMKEAGMNPHSSGGLSSVQAAVGQLPQYQTPELDFGAPSPLEAGLSGLAGAAGPAIGSYIGLRKDARSQEKQSREVKLLELEAQYKGSELNVQRNVTEPELLLQFAQRKQEYTKYVRYSTVLDEDGFGKITRTHRSESQSLYQLGRKQQRDVQGYEAEMNRYNVEIKRLISQGKILQNEYDDYVNAVTVRKGIDPRESPAFRRINKAMLEAGIDPKSWIYALVNVGASYFIK